ncbi:AAA domain-containing protein [Halomonas sp. HAL1]|nr:AAA domain-containing protein [Halomonas sp. HAL1]WKV94205.1 hypothetical protein Q3Y66_06180 [Halomonas sp. HAL1]
MMTAIKLINDEAPAKGVTREVAQSAWAMFFLMVPLVSTTFASFHRQFQQLENEDIGWLLIDEAGQAAPQHAAGAIWRSQRVMVVVDPFQLEPVVRPAPGSTPAACLRGRTMVARRNLDAGVRGYPQPVRKLHQEEMGRRAPAGSPALR